MLRVEDKYGMPFTDFTALKERVAEVLPADEFSGGREKGYKVSSLYFDDLYNTCYNDSVAGNPVRRKYRIRIYNDSFETIKLEIKTKKYNRISKESCLISLAECRRLINGDTIGWGCSGSDPRTIFNEAICSSGLRPVLIVTYDREAFVADAGNTRVAFDYNVRCSDRVECFGSSETVYDILENSHVLEIKYDEFIPDHLLQLMEQDTMLKISYSKYCNCREKFI